MNTRTDYRTFIRPSFIPVLAVCNAAALMSAAYVDVYGEPPSDEAADIGTDIHACVMLALLVLLGRWHPEDPLPDPDEAGALAKFPNMSAWDKACVRRCVTFAMVLITKTRSEHQNDDVEVLLEHHMDGSVIGIERGGTADLVIVVPFKLVRVIDWKAGFLDQGEAADHDSLASYAVMAGASFRTMRVEVFLFQPRSEESMRASGARFDAAELKTVEVWTRDVASAATEPNPEAVAGLHCTKCRALARCPVAMEFIMRIADPFTLIGEPSDSKAWGELITAAKVAKKFNTAAEESAKGHLIAGGTADGWALQPGSLQTKIDDEQAVKLAQDAGVVHLLLAHVSVKASAAKALPQIKAAVSTNQNAPSLKAVKASAKGSA